MQALKSYDFTGGFLQTQPKPFLFLFTILFLHPPNPISRPKKLTLPYNDLHQQLKLSKTQALLYLDPASLPQSMRNTNPCFSSSKISDSPRPHSVRGRLSPRNCCLISTRPQAKIQFFQDLDFEVQRVVEEGASFIHTLKITEEKFLAKFIAKFSDHAEELLVAYKGRLLDSSSVDES
ncbi:hypothetical protein SLA2020_274360 [Shorea laevis]